MFLIVLTVLLLVGMAGLGWAWYRQFLLNGRHLIRIETLEQQLNQMVTARDRERAMQNAAEGLPHGAVLGDFELPILGGGMMTRTEWRGRPLLLVYVAPGDPHSLALLRDLAPLPLLGDGGTPSAVVVSSGTEEENRKMVESTDIRFPVLMQEGGEAAQLVQVTATPSAYFVTPEDVVAGGLAVGHAQALALARGALAGSVIDRAAESDSTELPAEDLPAPGAFAASALEVGTPAPGFSLFSLAGDDVRLSNFRGEPVLLVFSQPDCPPCDAMSLELATLARDYPVPRVVMIARGDVDANRDKVRQFGFTFPVVVQKEWDLSRAYGVAATPSAYLIDGEGRVASPLAVGADPILTLARTGTLPKNYRDALSMEYS